MRRLLSLAVSASLALGSAMARAAPLGDAEATEPAQPSATNAEDDERALELAATAWAEGDWAEVRRLLEPLATDDTRLQDPLVREKALCYLADAVINDPGLAEIIQMRRVTEYLSRQMDADPAWRMPKNIYSPELYTAFEQLLDDRNQAANAQCQADRNSCLADLAALHNDYKTLQAQYDALKKRFARQEVEVREQVARSRFFAVIPFGIGQFYNGDRALGAAFLSAEVAAGLTGLGLLVYRAVGDGCRRRRAFRPGSLQCSGEDQAAILTRRRAEEGMGWVFWGTLALDILIAQLRFRPLKTVSIKRVPRNVLDADPASDNNRNKQPRRQKRPRAKVRPTGGVGRDGASLGVTFRF